VARDHKKDPNSFNWAARPRKRQARHSLLQSLREAGVSKVTEGRQFCSLSGRFADGEGNRLHGLEPDFLVDEGFITADQYLGVDSGEGIAALNRSVCPEYAMLEGGLLEALQQQRAQGQLRVEVLHVDSTNRIPRALDLFLRALNITAACPWPVWGVLNVVLRNSKYEASLTDEECYERLVAELSRHRLRAFFREQYKWLEPVAVYEEKLSCHTMFTALAVPRGQE
jgi:hypothetical protein